MEDQCSYCNRLYGEKYRNHKGWWVVRLKTIDHIVPRASGGQTTAENTIHCCDQCNTGKGSLSLYQWRDMIVEALANRDPQQGIILKKNYQGRMNHRKISDLEQIVKSINAIIE